MKFITLILLCLFSLQGISQINYSGTIETPDGDTLIGGQFGPFKFGYSYDYTLSDIGDYSQGSHEVFIEMQFQKSGGNSRTPWLKRNRIYSPKI